MLTAQGIQLEPLTGDRLPIHRAGMGHTGLNCMAGYIRPLCAKFQNATVLLVLLDLFLIKGIGAVIVTGA